MVGDTPSHFEGGETLLLDQGVLDYWRGYDGTRGLEAASIVERHDPTPFGRLLVFDGRVPHAVSRVKGSADPRRGRLVLTGWFSQPRPVGFVGRPQRFADVVGGPRGEHSRADFVPAASESDEHLDLRVPGVAPPRAAQD